MEKALFKEITEQFSQIRMHETIVSGSTENPKPKYMQGILKDLFQQGGGK